jgi:hypothetical protein
MSEETKTQGELVAAGLRDECDLRGLISESHNCIDCGYDTHPGCPNRAEAEQMIRAQKAKGIKNRGFPQTYNEHSEAYIVHRHVWKAAGMEPGTPNFSGKSGMAGDYSGVLCIGCLEKRIGRKLEPYDFPPDHPFNDPRIPGTRRRFERLTGCETVEGLEDHPEPPQASKLDLAFQKTLGKQWRAA